MRKADLALLLGSCLAAGLFLEGASRLLEKKPEKRVQQQLSARGYLVYDEELEYDIEPNSPVVVQPAYETAPAYDLWSNALGCYDKPYDKRLDPRPILLVGDSFTQGGAFERNWGTKLEELLGKRVLKCGVVGFGTLQESIKARKVARLAGIRPSVLVVGYYMNDLNDDYLSPGRTTMVNGRVAAAKLIEDFETGKVKVKTREALEKTAKLFEERGEVIECPSDTPFQKLKCALYLRSSLYRRVKPPLKALLERFQGASRLAAAAKVTVAPGRYAAFMPSKPWVEEAWARHLKSLDALQKAARDLGAELLVVVIPKREQVYPFLAPSAFDLPPGYDLEAPNRRLRAHMDARGIPYLDLLEPFRAAADQSPRPKLDSDKDLYWATDLHWNWNGHALGAKLVAERLKAGKARR